jgi:hypothetical protein
MISFKTRVVVLPGLATFNGRHLIQSLTMTTSEVSELTSCRQPDCFYSVEAGGADAGCSAIRDQLSGHGLSLRWGDSNGSDNLGIRNTRFVALV